MFLPTILLVVLKLPNWSNIWFSPVEPMVFGHSKSSHFFPTIEVHQTAIRLLVLSSLVTSYIWKMPSYIWIIYALYMDYIRIVYIIWNIYIYIYKYKYKYIYIIYIIYIYIIYICIFIVTIWFAVTNMSFQPQVVKSSSRSGKIIEHFRRRSRTTMQSEKTRRRKPPTESRLRSSMAKEKPSGYD